jgi:hypothetical protein
VFALALTAVELLCGRQALQGTSVLALAAQACDPDRRPTPRALGASVADDVEAAFERALAVDPLKRYADAGAFWKALERAAGAQTADLENVPIALRRRRVIAPRDRASTKSSTAARSTKAVRGMTVAFWTVLAASALLPSIAH